MAANYCKTHNLYYHLDEPCWHCEINELNIVIAQVKAVRNSLATQVLNSHAVQLLDKALQRRSK